MPAGVKRLAEGWPRAIRPERGCPRLPCSADRAERRRYGRRRLAITLQVTTA